MSVSPFVQPNFSAQTESALKTNYDNAAAVFFRSAGAFAPSAQDTPDLTVKLQAGWIPKIAAPPTEVALQNTATLTAPSANPRKDIIHIDQADGTIGVATGVEDASPVDPAVPVGKVSVARINWIVGQSSIVNADLDELRNPFMVGAAAALAGVGLKNSNGLLIPDVPHERKTADYTALSADRARLIEMDKATAITLNLTAAATLGEGWFVYVNNSGVGVLTVDPNGGELIDDAATITLGQNQSAIVFCDGAAFWTIGATVVQATQSAIELQTNVNAYVQPAILRHNPGVAKFWAVFNGTDAGPITPTAEHNVVDVTDRGTGFYTTNIDINFTDSNWSPYAFSREVSNNGGLCHMESNTGGGTLHLLITDRAGTQIDPVQVSVGGFGDQP